ncbi:MAG: DNA mismatch repair protein MutS [Bacteroidia bacterium]|nr:DNA mismatch repair protein MutS [Bacteroidia bacterium]
MAKQKEKIVNGVVETPLMKQYNSIKAKYPDALLLFRVGDFYETFGEDAVKASSILGIVPTKRANGAASFIDLAGFPHHSLDAYLPKLVRAGHRVAICDQLEDPKMTKTIVKRGVTELVTPGVSYNDKVLDHSSNNFLAALFLQNNKAGMAFLDISTGEFLIAEGSLDYAEKLLQSFKPGEVLYQKSMRKEFTEKFGPDFYSFALDEWVFTIDYAQDILLKHFDIASLKGFGVEGLHTAIIAAGAAIHYLAETQHDKVRHINKITRIDEEHYVWLDQFTIRNLELFHTTGTADNRKAKTLIEVIDYTVSPMGARLLKRWLAMPLKDLQPIRERLELVSYFMHHTELSAAMHSSIKSMGDIERLIAKVAVNRILPREMVQLKNALFEIKNLKELCLQSSCLPLQKIAEQLNPCTIIAHRIDKEINHQPPTLINKGDIINSGVDEQLDELRTFAFKGKDYLSKLQQKEAEATGIPSLKIAFNNVFGYYLEVTNTHKNKVPEHWVRKQTLTNAERYITPELKEYEEKILGAEEKILAIETKLYNDLVLSLMDYIQPVQLNASLIARIDCLLGFMQCALENNYVKPEINDSYVLSISEGRHPVIEKLMKPGESYVSNDIYLDNEVQQIMIITGPNMSGKSAVLRQTALIVMMAQMGSYVPAKHAQIGIIDKIFTRVGASDNISSGESTFMVEMNETASILNNLSARSLVLLDEIGRGTSTYDGISIAQSIAEYIHDHKQGRAKTLFATHYHELNDLAEHFKRIKNFNVAVKELDNKVLFLRKLVPGGSEHSFGIYVARMAGMPRKITDRANEILQHLESLHKPNNAGKRNQLPAGKSPSSGEYQLSFFQLDDPVLSEIKDELLKTDINTLTPVEALMKLNEIKKMVGGK